MIITIDGPAGSGKSTVAQLVAEKLGYKHLNSGSLYRAITAYFIENDIYDTNNSKFNKKIDNLSIKIEFINNVQHVFVNNVDYTSKLRDLKVSELSPYFSVNKKIRTIVDNCQKIFASKNNIVIDGRDIGSFVFPNADYKFYLDCSIDERARRRLIELKDKNKSVLFENIKKMISARDEFDKNKKEAPLIVPKNSIIIDSTNLNVNEVVNNMLNYLQV